MSANGFDDYARAVRGLNALAGLSFPDDQLAILDLPGPSKGKNQADFIFGTVHPDDSLRAISMWHPDVQIAAITQTSLRHFTTAADPLRAFAIIEALRPEDQARIWSKPDIGYSFDSQAVAKSAAISIGKIAPPELQASIYADSGLVKDMARYAAPELLANIEKLPPALQVKALSGPGVLEALTNSGNHNPRRHIITKEMSVSAFSFGGRWCDRDSSISRYADTDAQWAQASRVVKAVRNLAEKLGVDGIDPIFSSASVTAWLTANEPVRGQWSTAFGGNRYPPSLWPNKAETGDKVEAEARRPDPGVREAAKAVFG